MGRHSPILAQCALPIYKSLLQGRKVDSEEVFRTIRQVGTSSLEQRPGSDDISFAVMVKRHRNLNQPLEELSVGIH